MIHVTMNGRIANLSVNLDMVLLHLTGTDAVAMIVVFPGLLMIGLILSVSVLVFRCTLEYFEPGQT